MDRCTICLNTTRGKSFLRLLDPAIAPDNHTVFLFLISKGSEALHTYLDSDFAIVAHIVECEPETTNQQSKEVQSATIEIPPP